MNSLLSVLVSIVWPLVPQDSAHPIGNSWGEYQEYSGDPNQAYLHPGVDIMGVSVGKEVRAVAPGWVKAWMTIYADYHWRIATSDNNTDSWSDGWLYAHIDPDRWHAQLGDHLDQGDMIGYLVPWPIQGFDHLHFARIRHHGQDWNDAQWLFIQNPLTLLDPNPDTVAPVFESTGVSGSCDLAFKLNNSEAYLSPDSVFGAVDVVAKVHDKFGISWGYPTYERIGVYKISYQVRSCVPQTLSFLFKDTLDWDNTGVVYTIYEHDSRLQTHGDYSQRDFYYIVTNTNGDSSTTASDSLSSWDTSALPDGDYWFIVEAQDEAGNISRDSCLITLANGNSANENTRPGNIELGPTVFRDQSFVKGPDLRPRLFDSAGRELEAGCVKAGPSKWLIKPQGPGVFFLRVGQQVFTLVKTR